MPEPFGSEALSDLAERWKRDKSSRLFLQLAEELRRAGRTAEAAEVLEEGLRSHPESVAGLVALARCRLDLGTDRAAAGLLERALERDPAQLVANKLLTEAWIRLGDAAAARGRLDTYRILNERDAEIGELARRIEALDSRDEPRASSRSAAAEPIFDLGPLAGSLASSPIALLDELQPLPAGEAGSWAPFPNLHDRGAAEARIRARFAAEGVFASAPPAEPLPAAASALEPEPAPVAPLPEPLYSLQSLGDEVEREAESEPPGAQGAEGRAASATLASLYLQQGHLDEAEAEYRAVLEARPGDNFARSGLERIAQLRGVSGAHRLVRPAGLTQRKVDRLRGWLESLRRDRRSRG